MKKNNPTSPTNDPKAPLFSRAALWPYVVISLAFFMLTLPLIVKPEIDIFDDFDESHFHYPTIQQFAQQFPQIDLKDYCSATTPLYHLVLCAFLGLFKTGLVQLRLVSSLFSLGCLLLVFRYFSTRGETSKALFLTFLFMFSPYFLGPAIRLSTDNAALLPALLALYTLDRDRVYPKTYFLANLYILLAVLVRQIYAWLMALPLLIAFGPLKKANDHTSLWARLGPLFLPLAGLGFFLIIWKGLAPPVFAVGHAKQSLNWDAPVYICSLAGVYGLFFWGWLWEIRSRYRISFRPLVVIAILALAYLLIHPVSNQYQVPTNDFLNDRGGALWLVVARLPNLGSTALMFWGLFPLGLAVLFLMGRHLAARGDYLLIIAFGLWLAANMSNGRTYQKYYEPFFLFALGYVVMTLKARAPRLAWIGPGFLLLAFVGICIQRLFL